MKLRKGKPKEEVFDASHLERMLRSGKSEDARHYLLHFLLSVPFQDKSPLSDQLLHKVSLFEIFARVARGGEDAAVVASMLEETREEMCEHPSSARLNKIVDKMRADPHWAFDFWQQIEPGQVNMIMDMVSRCPELQGDVRFQQKRIVMWDPIYRGLCKCPSRCRKITNHVPSDVIARKFLLQKRLLTTQGGNGSAHSGSLSSHPATQHTEIEQVAMQPAVHEANGTFSLPLGLPFIFVSFSFSFML